MGASHAKEKEKLCSALKLDSLPSQRLAALLAGNDKWKSLSRVQRGAHRFGRLVHRLMRLRQHGLQINEAVHQVGIIGQRDRHARRAQLEQQLLDIQQMQLELDTAEERCLAALAATESAVS